MNKTIPLKYKILIVILSLLFLWIFNPFEAQVKNKEQNEFENWLNASKSSQSSEQSEKSRISISIKSVSPSRTFNWEIRSGDGNENAGMVERLLKQAREASLFDLDKKKDSEITLSVIDGEKTFLSRFNESDIEGNVKAALFLRLFEEYAAALNKGTQKKGVS